jgi:hypothetical protein
MDTKKGSKVKRILRKNSDGSTLDYKPGIWLVGARTSRGNIRVQNVETGEWEMDRPEWMEEA